MTMKKITLASCVMAASLSAQAELQPLTEYDLHGVTGQAGIDIDFDVAIDIGEIRYTDTANPDGTDGGSIVISDIHIGGGEGRTSLFGFSNPGNTANLDNLRFKIDVEGDGSVHILGEPTSGGVGVVDIELSVGEVALEGAGPNPNRHVLVDSINMYGGALALEMSVDGQSNDVTFYTEIGIEDLDIDMSSSFSLKIENAVLAGGGYLERVRAGRTPSASDRVAGIFVVMDTDSVPEGVKFDFTQGIEGEDNVIDVVMPSVSLGGQNLGSFTIDNFDFSGVSLVVSGH